MSPLHSVVLIAGKPLGSAAEIAGGEGLLGRHDMQVLEAGWIGRGAYWELAEGIGVAAGGLQAAR